MQPIEKVAGRYFRLAVPNIDTDAIIAAEWMKTLGRKGLGQAAFARMRGTSRSTFDEPLLAEAPILVAGPNFGCGSSREHAVWAMQDMGLQAVIAPSFSDIFAGNALRNGLLPLVLGEAEIETLLSADLSASLVLDLRAQRLHGDSGIEACFEIDPFWRERLLAGVDEIDATLAFDAAISRHEEQNHVPLPSW
jgi:3-isopropylmalate/(R)-2-methylmalate dehydratase small subunit